MLNCWEQLSYRRCDNSAQVDCVDSVDRIVTPLVTQLLWSLCRFIRFSRQCLENLNLTECIIATRFSKQ